MAPVLDGGRLRAQADIAASLRDRAVFACETVVRDAFADADNALSGVQRLGEQLAEAEQRRAAAAEVLRVAHNRYANGYASYSKSSMPSATPSAPTSRCCSCAPASWPPMSTCTGHWAVHG